MGILTPENLREAGNFALLALSFLKSNFLYILTALLLTRAIYRRYFHPLSAFPGPFWGSITHWYSVYLFFAGGYKMHLHELELHKRYGPVVRLKPDMLLIASASYLDTVFHLKCDKAAFIDIEIAGFGDAVITARSHASHVRLRKRIASAYSMTNIRRMETSVDAIVVSLLHQLNTRFAAQKKACDFALWAQYFAYDVVTDVAFGRAVGFVEAGKDVAGLVGNFHRNLPVGNILVRVRWLAQLLAMVPGLRWAMPKSGDEVGVGVMMTYRDGLIRERIREGNPEKKPDLLHHFLNAKNDDGTPMTFREIGDECYLIMVAGSDTTSAVLRLLTRNLYSNPAIMAKLYAELSSARLSRPVPTFDQLVKLPYLQAVLSEALRLGSLGMYIPRAVSEPGFECHGKFVPGGMAVAMNPWVLSQSKEIYGEDASEFNPERWLRGEEEKARLAKYEFAFGRGGRSCLGRNIALMELNKVVAGLVLGFEGRLMREGEEGVEYPGELRNLSIWAEKGMWVEFKLREGVEEGWAKVE
ncbi:cytochrome P450 [Ascobolus immersus RN42]|uniref:Cytochrome P450 n=1 Tax=Ascobolus immersus RN42 TaxID=1160509 RepID=A0A3N4HI85_ASCIM|nr:cytochrome P450 [Ascobolus immersus RN42]